MALQINCIWLGTSKLRPLDLFNVYSWRALGHDVTIYAYHFNGSHDLESLGLIEGAATVVDLPKLVEYNNRLATANDLEDAAYLDIIKNTENTRYVMDAWYRAVNPHVQCTIDHIYNMADITKSYIAGTRRGIVLDLKIGPSEHVRRCEDAGIFRDYFISFKRGTSTFGDLPENQCMGTMQEEDDLRGVYIKRFDLALSNQGGHVQRAQTPNMKQFDNLTGFHGKGWTEVRLKRKKTLDVTDKTKMTGLGLVNMEVNEIAGEVNYGPFRVFKRKADQTNTNMASTSPGEQVELCEYACSQQQQLGLVVNEKFHKERIRVAAKWKSSL